MLNRTKDPPGKYGRRFKALGIALLFVFPYAYVSAMLLNGARELGIEPSDAVVNFRIIALLALFVAGFCIMETIYTRRDKGEYRS